MGLTGRSERRRGKGPNQRVEKRRRENTERLEERREARTVEAERAAVRGRVEVDLLRGGGGAGGSGISGAPSSEGDVEMVGW